jgi:hypothetical protein
VSDAPKLTARSAEIMAHLFENPRMGVPRAVYWSCNVEFLPIADTSGQDEGADAQWPCTLLCDWITWPVRDWRQIDGLTLAECLGPVELEASLYFYSMHQPLTSIELSFRHTVANRFQVRGRLVGDFEDLEGSVLRGVSAEFEVDAEFVWLTVIPENLNPKTVTEAEALKALSAYADLQAYERPEWDDRRWLFRPKR